MDYLYASELTVRLWTAALFGVAALALAPFLRSRRREDEPSPLPGAIATATFGLWAILVLVALFAPNENEAGTGWRGALLIAALAVVPAGLFLTALIDRRPWLGCAACGLMSAGALAFPDSIVGVVLATATLLAVLGLVLTLFLNAYWSATLGYAAGAAALVALGGMTAAPAGAVLRDLCAGVAGVFGSGHVGIAEPGWLLLLLLVPVVVALGFRSLSGLGPVRRWVAITLRCLLVVFLTLALAEVHLRRSHEAVTVLFVWDRSLSIPPEFEGDGGGKDLREQRLLRFINDAVAKRGPKHMRDGSGLIVFGRWPRLELPPASVPRFNLKKVESEVEKTYTDIAGALKLALASFPEGSARRIVLISDGNENLGKAEEVALIARQNGVEIDVVPIAAGRRNQDEVLVERIEVPAVTEEESRLPIRIVIRSFNPGVVVGNLKLLKKSMAIRKGGDGEGDEPVFEDEPILETEVRVRQGLTAFYFQQPPSKKEAYTYEAKFVPLRVEDGAGKVVREGLVADRVENNRASASVIARGKRAILLVEGKAGEHRLLVERLQKTRSSLRVLAVLPGQLPQEPTQLTQFLTRFDTLILANIPAETLTDGQQKVIRAAVHDQGSGLVMIGGPQGYGAGGWQGTEVEKALPVTCDLRSMEVEGKSGLVLIMHASEIAEGNMWQKKIAQLAIEKLAPMDMVGVLHYNWDGQGKNQGHSWHIPFQQVGANRLRLHRLLDTMSPGDMPDADPSLKMALAALSDPKHNLGTKHIIFISDGDHWQPPMKTLAAIKAARITCTTVCITSHGQAEVARMKKTADATGGRSYYVKDPKQLPAIYIKETRLISKSFIHDKPFVPTLVERAGPTEGMPENLERLHGFVRTTPRPGPLVRVPIVKHEKKETFPILAYWHYGLGKAVAFTSDARAKDPTAWDLDWASTPMHAKFWEQVVDWSLRAVETGKNLTLTTEVRDGKVKVTVHTRDKDGRPITDLDLRGGITSPSLKGADGRLPELKFTQKGVGVYEAEVRAEDVGSYFIHVQASRRKTVVGKDGQKTTVAEVVDAARGGVSIPYSPEFAEMESNTGLLVRLAKMTGGKIYPDEAAALRQVAESGEVFRPAAVRTRSLQSIWFWLVLLTGVGLFFDVAVRRIALDPLKLAGTAQAAWAHLRGQAPAERAPEFLDRLQSRKVQLGETLEKDRAARRFEGEGGPTSAPPPSADEPRPAPRPEPRPAPQAQPAADEAGDFASRLMRAKKRAMEERDRDKGKP